MISDAILRKYRITDICEHSREISPGSLFDSVEFAEKPLRFAVPASEKVVCVGPVSDDETLFRTADGRYRFSSVGGCGSEDGRLYCVALGFFYDFGHQTDDANVIDECSAIIRNSDYHSSCGALEYAARREALNKIIKAQSDYRRRSAE